MKLFYQYIFFNFSHTSTHLDDNDSGLKGLMTTQFPALNYKKCLVNFNFKILLKQTSEIVFLTEHLPQWFLAAT